MSFAFPPNFFKGLNDSGMITPDWMKMEDSWVHLLQRNPPLDLRSPQRTLGHDIHLWANLPRCVLWQCKAGICGQHGHQSQRGQLRLVPNTVASSATTCDQQHNWTSPSYHRVGHQVGHPTLKEFSTLKELIEFSMESSSQPLIPHVHRTFGGDSHQGVLLPCWRLRFGVIQNFALFTAVRRA